MDRLSDEEFSNYTANVTGLTPPSASIIEAQTIMFDGQTTGSPLADWAHLRGSDFGETIKPERLYLVNKEGHPHTVAWLQRTGLNQETGDTYSFHHVACDCMLEAELREDPELMFSCDSLNAAIVRRALEVGKYYGLHYYEQPTVIGEIEESTEADALMVGRSILYILEHDLRYPEAWMANYLSGRHELPILSIVLHREETEIADHIEELKESGFIEVLNGTTIRVPQTI